METIKITPCIGEDFLKTATTAKTMASEQNVVVEYIFNGITCMVDSETDVVLLFRDYQNSDALERKTIGPECKAEYSQADQQKLEQKQKERDEFRAKQMADFLAKREEAKAELLDKINGEEIELSDPEKWKSLFLVNKDDYGSVILEYAEYWAKLMQLQIKNGQSVAECAGSTAAELYWLGMSGHQYGLSVATLSACWKHGRDLKLWHNQVYMHIGEGVANPTKISIKS